MGLRNAAEARKRVRSLTLPLPILALLAGVLFSQSALARPSSVAAPRKKVVVMVGLPGAGKTTLAKALSRINGAPRHTCGDVIRGWVDKKGLAQTPANMQMASKHFAAKPGTLAGQLANKIQASPEPVHIVDGVRGVADMKVLKQRFDVKVVALKITPRQERYDRLLARGRSDIKEGLKNRDRREIGLGVLHVLRKPFRRVDNSGPLSRVPSLAKRLAADLDRAWSK